MLQANAHNNSIFKSLKNLLLRQPAPPKGEDEKMLTPLEGSIEQVALHLECCMT
jgi:hypothetical protein